MIPAGDWGRSVEYLCLQLGGGGTACYKLHDKIISDTYKYLKKEKLSVSSSLFSSQKL